MKIYCTKRLQITLLLLQGSDHCMLQGSDHCMLQGSHLCLVLLGNLPTLCLYLSGAEPFQSLLNLIRQGSFQLLIQGSQLQLQLQQLHCHGGTLLAMPQSADSTWIPARSHMPQARSPPWLQPF